MERSITLKLQSWKDAPKRKPLLLTGVRQCGKTYTIKTFGDSFFEDVAYFNFEEDKTLSSLFDYDLDVTRIVDELGNIIRGKTIVPGKTLVIFDEIQACPNAITALKYFCENLRSLHVIAAGSLLGVEIKRSNISFPVGKVDRMIMRPMSFSEFVVADGGSGYINALSKFPLGREIPDAVSIPLEKYLKQYYVIGGMPEVVQTWIDTHDYAAIEKVQDSILADYADDFAKYPPRETVPKINLIWRSVPVQLAKENNKFVFSHVKSGARAKDLEDAMQWLVDAGLLTKLHMVAAPELPLSYCADATYFKVFMSDVGLLRRASGVYYKTILLGDENYVRFKGALTENYVLNELLHLSLTPYFWRSGNGSEVDFVIEHQGRIIPIEVKSADNTRAKSFRVFCQRYSPQVAFKTSLKNVGDNMDGGTNVWSVPLYTLFRLDGYLGEGSNKKEQ